MGNLYDVLLAAPIGDAALRALLFGLFALHFLFVLFLIGTALLSVYYFIHTQWHPRKAEKRWEWAKDILHTFMAHKSLAVVLGVGALLLMQVGYSIPFITGVNLFAPYWLLIILFLIGAFLLLDFLGQNWDVRPYLHLVYGILGLLLLLAVPGIFVAVLIATEQPGFWTEIIHNGYRLPGPLAWHWLFRYLHVLGASIVFGAAFHYFFSKDSELDKKQTLYKWISVCLGLQIAVGIGLYLSLPDRPGWVTNAALIAGILAVLIAAAVLLRRQPLRLTLVAPLLLAIFLPMLLARQTIQDRALQPVLDQARQQSAQYRQSIEPHLPASLDRYQQSFDIVYDRGEVIYPRSCGFCHGEQALGDGMEAAGLAIPPEKLAYVRADRLYLRDRVLQGIPGTGMPYFTVFSKDKLDDTFDLLDQRYGIYDPPAAPAVAVSSEAAAQAQTAYYQTCITCHGGDGKGATQFSAGYNPPPPDLTRYTLEPDYMYDVITRGYPGTLMVAFDEFPEDVRWGLVSFVQRFYQGQSAP